MYRKLAFFFRKLVNGEHLAGCFPHFIPSQKILILQDTTVVLLICFIYLMGTIYFLDYKQYVPIQLLLV